MMYRRYEPMQNNNRPAQNTGGQQRKEQTQSPQGRVQNNRQNTNMNGNQHGQAEKPVRHPGQNKTPKGQEHKNKAHPITKFIPQSVYNPETGKIFGFLSAEDLLIIALIITLLDGGGDDCKEDNSILIYALIYILLSEYIKLPI